MEVKIKIKDLSIGSAVTIVGYNRIYGGYVGQLLSKNLTIGQDLVLLDKSMPEGKVKIMLKEKIVQLSKPEADALWVEIVGD